ncbi:flagellar assembly protein FliH [Terrilactibacillus laevilacticus]|uniref:Flagellar assembly protein FliH n=1 Tax=Terrilactibacillus laevilacticus TaxID=1380157 RepID=A0ABW5PPW6_9BACI|nr:flagellar assembly protein FliH [Terrilactibacillus laevilacticus]
MSNVIKSPFHREKKKIIKLETIKLEENKQTSADLTTENMIQQAQQKADEILTQAKRISEQLLEERKQEELHFKAYCEQQVLEKRKEGYEDGFSKGESEGYEAYLDKLKEADNIIVKANHTYQKILSKAEPDIILLSIQIAEKIISTSLESGKENWISLVKAAINEVKDQDEIHLTVSPTWFEYLNDCFDELQTYMNQSQLFIHCDMDMKDHDCVIETPLGKIDASVDTQLSVIKSKLLDILGESQ